MIPALYPALSGSDLRAFFQLGKDCSAEFEKKLKDVFKVDYAVTFSSGRAGLYHVLKAHNIQDKAVLTSAYTCSVVTEAIVQSGNQPVLIDTREGSFNAEITEEHIRKHGDNIGGVVITNLFGVSDFSEVSFQKKQRDFLVILDDALSPGHIKDRPPGVYDYILVSCEVRKPFTCLGGGIIFTDDKNRFQTLYNYTVNHRLKPSPLRQLKKFLLLFLFFFAFRPLIFSFTSFMRRKTPLLNCFFSEKEHDIHQERPEYHENMYSFQKRVGMIQLQKFEHLISRRKEISNTYYDLLSPHFTWIRTYWKKDVPFSHVPFLHPERDALEQYLLKRKIDTERYFDYVVADIDQYRIEGSFPNAARIAARILNLPINMGLTKKVIADIADQLIRFEKASSSPGTD